MTIDSPTRPTSLQVAIRQHEQIVRSGATHSQGCPACRSRAFKRQRLWLRTIRFLEFDARLSTHVVQAVKITIARVVCMNCLLPWTDYPDFRLAS